MCRICRSNMAHVRQQDFGLGNAENLPGLPSSLGSGVATICVSRETRASINFYLSFLCLSRSLDLSSLYLSISLPLSLPPCLPLSLSHSLSHLQLLARQNCSQLQPTICTIIQRWSTLDTTLGQIVPPKIGHLLERYLNQVAFPES